jgi:ATP-binding cassette subfamily B (MDR/TAP) protein 1
MQRQAVRITYYWLAIMATTLIGNVLAFKGFGTSKQSLSKRLRDMTFKALCRQEVGYFDLRSVGVITSQLQDDVTKIDAFTGQPLRELVTSMCSVLVGFIIALVHMWPFALLALAYLPLMGFVTYLRSKTMLGEDQGDDHKENKEDAAGIMVETLLNMRTVAALNLEQSRYNDYKTAVDAKDAHYVKNSTKEGLINGMAAGVEQWVNGLQFYWGGYLLTNYPNQFSFQDFLVAMFALLLSLFGAGGAKIGAIDKKEATAAAERLFSLIHRRSAIDSMATDGKKMD